MEIGNKWVDFVSFAPFAQQMYKNNNIPGFPVDEYQIHTLKSVLNDQRANNCEYYFLRDNIKGRGSFPPNVSMMGTSANGCILEFEKMNLFIKLASIESYRTSMPMVENFDDGNFMIMGIDSMTIYFEAFAYGNIKPNNINKKHINDAIEIVRKLIQNPKSVNFKLHFVVDDLLDTIYSQWMNQKNSAAKSPFGGMGRHNSQQARYRYPSKKEKGLEQFKKLPEETIKILKEISKAGKKDKNFMLFCESLMVENGYIRGLLIGAFDNKNVKKYLEIIGKYIFYVSTYLPKDEKDHPSSIQNDNFSEYVYLLPNLKKFYLSYNSDQPIKGIENLIHLQVLHIQLNTHKMDLEWINQLEDLRCLLIGNGEVYNYPSKVHNLSKLIHLQTHGTKITVVPATFSNFENLEALGISENLDEFPDFLLESKSLKFLQINNSKLLKKFENSKRDIHEKYISFNKRFKPKNSHGVFYTDDCCRFYYRLYKMIPVANVIEFVSTK